MRVALYVRRSTVDLQPDSLAAQEELLRAYAARNGLEIVRVYTDSASGRQVGGRGGETPPDPVRNTRADAR